MSCDPPDPPYALTAKRVYVAGHTGLLGSALCRHLKARGDCTVLTTHRTELDLRDPAGVRNWMAASRPDAVILAAARVGGILANRDYPADFIYDNLMIAANVIHAAHEAGVDKLLFPGSSCIYPKHADQPVQEDSLLTGPLEPTNEPYAVAKIAGLKLCQAYAAQYGANFITAMPTNLYGPGDNFDRQDSHVIPGLIARMHDAKLKGDPEFPVWGSGQARREFLHADDCAAALVFLLENYSGPEPVNIGSGTDIPIADLAERIRKVTGYGGKLVFDGAKPDGTPRKLLDSSRISGLGWRPRIDLNRGLAETYDWYLQNLAGNGSAPREVRSSALSEAG